MNREYNSLKKLAGFAITPSLSPDDWVAHPVLESLFALSTLVLLGGMVRDSMRRRAFERAVRQLGPLGRLRLRGAIGLTRLARRASAAVGPTLRI